MYKGVPTKDCISSKVFYNLLANPKSVTLNTSSYLSIFAGLRSLWIIYCDNSWFKPFKICLRIKLAFSYVNFPFYFKKDCRSPELQNSDII